MATRNPLKKQETVIAKQIALLQRKQETLRKKHRAPMIKNIVQKMREFAITPDELVQALGSKPGTRAARQTVRTSAKPKTAVQPKYLHPKTGETWSGRGKAPRWLTAAEAAGEKREHFLIVH